MESNRLEFGTKSDIGTVRQMSEQHISLAEARKQLGELLAQVSYTGDRIILTKHGKPRAALVSMEDLVRLRAEVRAQAHEPAPRPEPASATFAHSRAQVWNALTDVRTRAAWWLDAFIDARVDGAFIQYWSGAKNAPQTLRGRISEFEEGERFQVRWDEDTYSTVELTGEDGAITVTVTHTAGKPPPGWQLDFDDLRAWLNAKD